jgi:hypothetical protein
VVEKLDAFWTRFGAYTSRPLLGSCAVVLVLRIVPQYRYLLPPEWANFALAVMAAFFLLGYRAGFYSFWVFLGLLAVAAFGAFGTLLSIVAIAVFPSVTGMVQRLTMLFPGMNREFRTGAWTAGKEALLAAFAPFLFAMGLGFSVPLLAGLMFGYRGIAVAVSSCLLSTIAWALCGRVPWGFPSGVAASPNLLSVAIPQARNMSLFDIFRPRPVWDGTGGPFIPASVLPDFTKLPHLLAGGWEVIRANFASRPLLWAQAILWGLCAFSIARLRGQAPSPGRKATAALAGTAVLVLGYALLPLTFESGHRLALPGGVGLFAYYLATSLGLALLTMLAITQADDLIRIEAEPGLAAGRPGGFSGGPGPIWRAPSQARSPGRLGDPTAGIGQPVVPPEVGDARVRGADAKGTDAKGKDSKGADAKAKEDKKIKIEL